MVVFNKELISNQWLILENNYQQKDKRVVAVGECVGETVGFGNCESQQQQRRWFRKPLFSQNRRTCGTCGRTLISSPEIFFVGVRMTSYYKYCSYILSFSLFLNKKKKKLQFVCIRGTYVYKPTHSMKQSAASIQHTQLVTYESSCSM